MQQGPADLRGHPTLPDLDAGPDDTCESRSCEPLSDADLGRTLAAALEGNGDAVALIDRHHDRLLWCSTAFAARYPDAFAGSVWQSWRRAREHTPPETATTLDARATASTPVLNLVGPTGEPSTLSMEPAGARCWLIRLLPPAAEARRLHDYLQARSDLFETASSLSVSEMATSLAHEINQPIGAITNLLHGIKARLHRDPLVVDELDRALDKALEQARYTASVVSRIRDFTEARRPRMAHHELGALIRRSARLLDWLLSNRGCRLQLDLPAEPVGVTCDATLFQQVMINLLRNAIEAMEHTAYDRRLIRIRVELMDRLSDDPVEQDVQVSICDEGHGLTPGDPSLFVPFATHEKDGMGVGLTICRSFVELHQGRLWLTPNPDAGCTAWIRLPATPAASP